MDGFVWAIRLAKLHKGMLSRDWNVGPHAKGATFSAKDEYINIVEFVRDEGLQAKVVEDESLDCAFIIQDSA